MASQFGGYGGSDFADAAYAGQATTPTTTATQLPTLTVLIAFTTAPGSANPVFVDVSDDVRSVRTRRGRQRELDKYQAGTCEIVLDNRNRQYDPSYSAGPNFGNIKPMKRIKVLATYAGVTYGVFDGYADNWSQQFENPKEARCHLSATDGFKVLAIQTLQSAWVVEMLADNPFHWWRLAEPTGSTVAIDTIGTANGTYDTAGSNPFTAFGATSLIINDSNAALTCAQSGGYIPFDATQSLLTDTWTIEIWVNGPDNPNAADHTLFYQDATGGGANGGITLVTKVDGDPNVGRVSLAVRAAGGVATITGTVRVDDSATHHVVATRNGTALAIYVDGVLDASGTLADDAVFNGIGVASWFGQKTGAVATVDRWKGTVDEAVVYNKALTATRISAHNSAGKTPWTGDLSGARITRLLNAVGWPATDRNIATGQSVLQSATISGSVLTHAQAVETTEAGLLFMSKDGKVTFSDRTARYASPASLVTFGDSGAEIGYQTFAYDVQDQPISNDVSVTRVGGSAQTAKDATSISDYYDRTLTLSGLLHQTDTISQTRAQFEVANRKDLIERVTTLEVLPQASPATYFPAVLARELNDSVTVNRRPQGVGTLISQLSHVEGIQNEIAPMYWKAIFYVSPVSGIATDGTSVSKQYWILGVAGASELGQTTRLGF